MSSTSTVVLRLVGRSARVQGSRHLLKNRFVALASLTAQGDLPQSRFAPTEVGP
jgi:hypothetical protein